MQCEIALHSSIANYSTKQTALDRRAYYAKYSVIITSIASSCLKNWHDILSHYGHTKKIIFTHGLFFINLTESDINMRGVHKPFMDI
jgi:hypothetical protein